MDGNEPKTKSGSDPTDQLFLQYAIRAIQKCRERADCKYAVVSTLAEYVLFGSDGCVKVNYEKGSRLYERVTCDERLTGNGADYRGCQSMTTSGRTCQNWDMNIPFEHADKSIEKGAAGNNYCRNPTGKSTIWCYTTDPFKRWEECDPIKATVKALTLYSGDFILDVVGPVGQGTPLYASDDWELLVGDEGITPAAI